MSKFIEHIFSLKQAYAFGETPQLSLKDYFSQELGEQLGDLEQRLLEMAMERWEESVPLKKEIQYQRSLQRLEFRLQEILRFIERSSGPRIVLFVCSEIYDLIQEKKLLDSALGKEEIERISIILTVTNSYFRPEVVALRLTTLEEVAQRLQDAVKRLLKR